METQSFFGENTSQAKPEGLPFDVKRVFYRASKYWYFVVASLIIALGYAYFLNRYTARIYPISASIIIKESQETGGAELLYNNALINQYRNYLNEPYIIRSFPLIQQVVEDLNYDIRFYREGRLTKTDAYDYVPVSATLARTQEIKPVSAIFTIVSSNQFTLRTPGELTKADVLTFNFGDTIAYGGNRIVFQKRNKNNDKEYLNSPFLMNISNVSQVTAGYVSRLGVTWAEQGSGVINLSLNGSNVEREVDFLKGLINRYQQNDLDKKNLTAVRTIEFISKEIKSLSDSMRVVERRLQQFKNIGQATDLSSKGERLLDQLEEIEKSKTEFLVKENYYEYLTKYLNNDTNLDQIILPSSMGISDGVVTDIITRLEKMQFDIKLGREMNKEGNPLLLDKQLRINQIKKDIFEAIKTMRSTDKIKLDLINGQLRTIEGLLDQIPVTERQYVSIKRNYSLMENLYIFLMQKLSEAKISRAANAPDIIIVNPPKKAGGYTTPKVGQNYSIGVIVGLIVPFLIFGMGEFLNNKIQSKEDIDKISTVPFIGGIGHSRRKGNLIVQDKPKSSIAESFRALRSNLHYFTGNRDKNIFLVTSSISGEGKTFTTINLASVLAMSGKKTLIIGADMRKPKLYGDFGLGNEVGLSTYLSGISTLDESIQATSYAGLSLLSGGPSPPNPSELLMIPQMGVLIKELLTRYDYIVIDTPPIALVTDAFVLSQYADHIIFLVRQNFTPKALLRNVEEFYLNGRLKKISIILNDIYKTGPGYGYGYNYGYGYGYSYGDKKKNASYYEEDDSK